MKGEVLLLFILESVGSTELVFILVMALVFFGPRKLPQLSRSLGKSLAEFRRASDEFKRTWEREVALEKSNSQIGDGNAFADVSPTETHESSFEPRIEAVGDERAVSRLKRAGDTPTDTVETHNEVAADQPLNKHDWL